MDNFFDNLKKTTSNIFSTAMKKSSKVVEQSKYTLAISAANSDIKERYESIGKLIYQGYKDNSVSSEEVEAHCKYIDERLAEIEEYRKKLNEIKSVKACPSCNAQVSDDSAFCAKCGKEL
ncbi:MAG: zinc ribbon domain-containing protein [Eubacteriales bacterium]|jgi:methyl-accepting chemotaxis protein|nr:zinc ribbon domain-containing protein [Eubacteriales bacterium]